MFDGSHRVDPNDSLPRHAQVQKILRELVESGRLRPGDKIPAEVQIADALGVSKMTVNKALLALTGEGLLVREVGRGTFIADGAGSAHAARTIAVDEILTTGAGGRTLPRVSLSFVEGARDVLGSDYYGTLYRGFADYFGVGTDAPKVQLSMAPLAATNYAIEDEQLADGRLIVAPRASYVPSVNALWRQGKAAVVVGASWDGMGVPCVDSDNVGASALAIRHLTEQGHRRIVLLYAEPETANTQDRIEGYRRTLLDVGIALEPDLEVEALHSWKAGNDIRARLHTLLTAPQPVTAIFAAGYYLALEALAVAHEAGLRVPRDVSVIGFDDPIGAQLAYPPLTTLRQPLYEMGIRAAERLMALMAGQKREVTCDTLTAQLIVRRSTGPAPGNA